MRIVRDQRGFTATELLFAATIFIVLLGAALGPLDGMWKGARDSELQNESQELARKTVDQLTTELRSASTEPGGQADLIERATANELILRTVDGRTAPAGTNTYNVKRVRFCMSGTTLVRQQQTWSSATAPVLSATTCPDVAWAGTTEFVHDVVNGGTPIFTYDTATLASIRTIGLYLSIDPTGPAKRPRPTELRTTVTLRNRLGS